MAGLALVLALLQAAAPAPQPQVHTEPLAGSLPPLDAPDGHGPGGYLQRGPLFLSPMGEPFRGHNPQYIWFDQADANHDGALTLSEFEADAMRWFKRLDRGHDGEIDPDDIDYYETALAPEIRVGGAGGGGGSGNSARSGGGRRHRGGGGMGGGPGGGSFGGGGGGGHGLGQSDPQSDGQSDETAPRPQASYGGRQGAARYSWFDYPEPITVADTNFNRGVDASEWRKATDDRFAVLDKNGDGVLKRGELPALPDAGHEGRPNGRMRGAGPGRHADAAGGP